jgi:hypothetical protein
LVVVAAGEAKRGDYEAAVLVFGEADAVGEDAEELAVVSGAGVAGVGGDRPGG